MIEFFLHKGKHFLPEKTPKLKQNFIYVFLLLAYINSDVRNLKVGFN